MEIMRVKILINCETESEILVHLSVIRSSIKAKLKANGEFTMDQKFTDVNCYGDHEAYIELGKVK